MSKWVLVPETATDAMFYAGCAAHIQMGGSLETEYVAMLAARPAPSEQDVEALARVIAPDAWIEDRWFDDEEHRRVWAIGIAKRVIQHFGGGDHG